MESGVRGGEKQGEKGLVEEELTNGEAVRKIGKPMRKEKKREGHDSRSVEASTSIEFASENGRWTPEEKSTARRQDHCLGPERYDASIS